ncbi:MAG TPA: hypothetical protein VE978_07705 [Chitinophagales bacterium]|nr:hypothetical protein [Chitinophagales bacterium]
MRSQLFVVKLIHSIVWLLLATTTFYILYSGLFNRITPYTWIAIAMIVGEGIVLLIYKWTCPLTVIARKYSDSQKDNFDIFLPNWLAKHNKTIFTTIFFAGIILVLYRMLSQ